MMEMLKSRKGQWWMASFLGAPFIFIVIILLIFLALVFGIVFLFKNIIWISIIIGGLAVAYQLAKNKHISGREFIGFITILLTVWFLGSALGLLMMGAQNKNVQISIEPVVEAQPLAYGYGYEDYLIPEDRVSFTCMSPFAETLGCRLAPGTYRPVKITIKNTDPELPLPPSLIVLTVDMQSLRVNQEVDINELKRNSGVEHGDVFLVNTRDKSVWDRVVGFIKRENELSQRYGSKAVFLVLDQTLQPGESVTLGVDSNNDPYLFLVADRGAKLNTQHILQVALLETTKSDVYRYGSCEGIIGCISHNLGKIGVLLYDKVCSLFKCTDERTVFAVGVYKFNVAYPKVEIIVILGIIGVVALAVSKLLRLW